uniref:HAT C-terminal dimerisation domain-containing protein n=1 Tax=Phaseolus vulgaris TaxID=3885 RepID=V7AR50_PHAVU|nr:hypothetical protein PHAVU_010G101400g [Phaseolus vulgaris]ESW07098.1 hypothetical protein PHAVU_010G101400g [Phaseolus vulgaris]
MRGALFLIKVLRMVDSEIGLAKEKIQSLFNGEIIYQRWDNQLLMSLHAAGYYLNPMLHYHLNLKLIMRIRGYIDEISKIDVKIESFKSKSRCFGSEIAQRALKTKTLVQWRESYGDEHPELQRFAVRGLSLTCSSSCCERNWSASERKTMNDVVFVMANSRLMKKKDVRKTKDYNFDDLASNDEWTMEDNEANDIEPMGDLEVPIAEDDEGHDIDNINENENLVEEDDDYPLINMKDFIR